MSREALLKKLTANVDEETRQFITSRPTPVLQQMVSNAQGGDDDDDGGEDDDSSMEENEDKLDSSMAGATGAGGTVQAGGKGTVDEYAKPTAAGTAGHIPPRPTGNRRDNDVIAWLKSSKAPPAIRAMITNQFERERQAKLAVVRELVGNMQNVGQRKVAGDSLMALDLEVLKGMLPPRAAIFNEADDFGLDVALMTGNGQGFEPTANDQAGAEVSVENVCGGIEEYNDPEWSEKARRHFKRA